MHGRLVAGGLRVYLRDVTSETRIATFMCIVSEDIGKGQHRPHGGYGCHPDARVAALRADGSRDQPRRLHSGRTRGPSRGRRGPRLIPDADLAFGGGPTGSFADVPSVEFSSVGADVALILERFAAVGFSQVVAVDLTRPELGVPVVRVVVPFAESWSIFHLHLYSAAIGRRALAEVY